MTPARHEWHPPHHEEPVGGLQDFVVLWRHVRERATRDHLALAAAGFSMLAVWALLASFLLPHTVRFNFAGSNCFTNPTFLPGLVHQQREGAFVAVQQKTIAITGHALYSHTTCIQPISAPRENAVEHITLRFLGIGFLGKTIRVATGTPPSVHYRTQLNAPIPTDKTLVFELTAADYVFEYRLSANGRTAPCAKRADRLACGMSPLHLAQSANYTLSMQRLFAGSVQATVFSRTATTVGAVQLAGSSIGAGQTAFDIPTHLTLTFNKPIKSFTGAQLSAVAANGSRQKVAATVAASGSTLTFTFAAPLARSTSFEARVTAITAADGGRLPEPFVLGFSTSGGPKVQSTSIGSYKVSTSGNIALTFDTAVSAGQPLSSFIQLQIGGSPVAASLTRSGNQVIINPAADLPRCTRFTLQVLDGLQNEAGVAGGSAWSYASRTICQTSFSIGSSVKGRGIIAYRFGGGSSLIVFTGTLHGNERSANYTLASWMDYLERNYDSIPAGRTIVVIPTVNPDGFAADARTNANNVDLNRNFPTSDWKQSVTMPGGAINPNGGGPSPLSEPESSALASYIGSAHPRLVLDYHATAGIVEPNDAGDSDALARTYDSKSNLNYSGTDQNATVFTYDTTGSFEDWAAQAHSIPVVLVELWTYSGNEFSHNQTAMWYMATL